MTTINSVTTALEALEHEDAGIRYHGAWWLGKHRVVEAIPQLMQCLSDQRDQTATGGYPLRRQAARSLGMIKDSSCIPELFKTLETDDVQLHEATLRALIEIKSDQCAPSLISYLDRDLHNKPIEALIEALAEHEVWEVSEKIRPFLNSSSERVASSAAAFFFSYTGEQPYLDQITSRLDHQNRFIRQSAAFDLARLGTTKAAVPILNSKIPNNVKMFAIKSILESAIQQPRKTTDEPLSIEANSVQVSLFNALDNLARENFAGNLLIDQEERSVNTSSSNNSITNDEILIDAFQKLRSPSLAEREVGIKQIVLGPENLHNDLSDLYFTESDQDIKMGLIKAMAEIKSTAYITAFIDAIGAEIGNHCQGNIRRVAACALGDVDWKNKADSTELDTAFKKLEWTLHTPEDWGLRYSACLALERIHNADSVKILLRAKAHESDTVVSTRLAMALSI